MSYNKHTLVGNLGQDPEVKELKSGTKVAVLNIATSERYKDKDGEKQERTDWHRVELWGRQAEVAEEYLSKGDMILVEGKVQTDKWEDQEGNNRYTTKTRAGVMQMLKVKGKDNKEHGGGDGESAATQTSDRGGGSPSPSSPQDESGDRSNTPPGGGGGAEDEGETDELPF